jgi:hypothetical protein
MEQDFSGWLWFLVDVVLVAALGLAMLYGIAKWRRARHDPGSEHARDRATKQVYRDR